MIEGLINAEERKGKRKVTQSFGREMNLVLITNDTSNLRAPLG